MIKKDSRRSIVLFMALSFLFSWTLFTIVDGWLEPMFTQQGNEAAARMSVMFGHTLAMLGPALAALLMWRVYHKESLPSWRWSSSKYYLWIASIMLAFWTLPGVIGLIFGDKVISPVPSYMWINIAVMLILGWVSGVGEELGWCAYLLPKLSPEIGKTRALIVSGAIRGLWHWPVLVLPVITQVIEGDRTILELLGAGVVIAVQLVFLNILHGSVQGWIWYRTESIPLVGWTHYWHNLTRDVTAMLLVGYASGLWVTVLSGFAVVIIGFVFLDLVRKSEGVAWWQLLGRGKNQARDEKPASAEFGEGTRVNLARSSALSDKMKAYNVLIDGIESAQIQDGQTISVPLSPGDHIIQMGMDWCRSPRIEFSLNDGESVHFDCGSNLAGWKIFLSPIYITLLRNRYIWIRLR